MYKILVADDEADERALIRFLLRDYQEDFELYEAKNGKEALALINQYEIDILLSDIQMGIMSGIELAAQIRKTHPDLEILFFSGYDDFEYVRSALSLRAVNYILKPVNPEELKKSLSEIIDRLNSRNLQFVKSTEYIERGFYDDGSKAVQNGQEYSEADAVLMREIEAAITMKNTDVLRDQVNELLSRYAGSKPRSHIYVRYICTSLLQQLMQQLPCSMEEFEEAAGKIYMFRHFSDIEKLIQDYLERVIDQIRQEINSSNYVVYQVKQYIDLHFQEDLNLNQLADQVFLSPNYLSNVFTKYTGCSLSKYIKQVRLTKAKELLCTTNMKIAEVGKKVGYVNTSYFIKKYQEMYGTTPEKYRMNLMEGKSGTDK
ncbi:MAG: response regulator [Lachnospiraceae bacterium]|nr:response regulator [Lachnospiraceae bacterium]